MYYLKKRLEIAGAHQLQLDYDSKCCNLHGHNWIIEVHCRTRQLDKNGMVTDFSRIKEVVMKLDHQNLNVFFAGCNMDMNTTAENIAKFLCHSIPNCYKVTVIESENNEVTYEEDGLQ